MREVTDDALQRLYWACRRRSGFPGEIPDETAGSVTPTDILKGLGLIKPDFDEFELPKEATATIHVHHSAEQAARSLHALKPRDHEDFDENQSVASPTSIFSSPRGSDGQAPTTHDQAFTSESATSMDEFDMKEQFLAYSPPSYRPVLHGRKSTAPHQHEQRQTFVHRTDDGIEPPPMDLDAFLDVSLCTAPTAVSQPSCDNYPSVQYSVPLMTTPHPSRAPSSQSPTDLIYDSYLSPWPGSLVAAP